MNLRLSIRPTTALLAAALCAAPAAARGQGVSGQAQGGYSSSSITSRDETGQETRSDADAWTQRYRLAIDEAPYALVRFGASGLLDWVTSRSNSEGVRNDSDTKIWDGNAHLTFGGPVLSGGLDYGRRQQTTTTSVAGVSAPTVSLIRDIYSASGSWHPLDLPTLDLRLSRTDTRDAHRASLNLVTSEVLLASRFEPVSTLDLRYSVRYSDVDNGTSGVRTRDVTNSAVVTWHDRFLGDRGNAYVSYALVARNSDTSTGASGSGTVATQRFPTGGLSLVEGPLDTPTLVALRPNAALVDGVTNVSAGVNLGMNASSGAVVTGRDLGAQLADEVTRVSLIYVFVDRNVDAVARELTWDAYESVDNATWTRIAPAGAVRYDPLTWRFEIPIQPTTRKYVKVVTRPIARRPTIDAQFSDIFVTELQLFDVVPASEVRGRTSSVAGTLNGTTRFMLLRAPQLVYDLSALVTHSSGLVTWSVVNGLSTQRRLGASATAQARVDRADSDAGKGHEAVNRVSASLSADPLPTLGGTLSYTGQLGQTLLGTTLSHSGTAFARADVYEGISASATGNVGWARSEAGRVTRSSTGSLATSVVPNRVLSTTESVSFTYASAEGGGIPPTSDRRGIVELSATLSPYRSFLFSGSVLRYFGKASSTLVSFNGAVSVFPGGDLQLRYGYQETLDTGAEQRSRTHGPGLRWNIRPGWYLDAAYTFLRTTAPAQTQFGQVFGANLVITLR